MLKLRFSNSQIIKPLTNEFQDVTDYRIVSVYYKCFRTK
ncbi:hypothetical protein MARI151_60504 [Maribacter litoralis]|uniref:Uncharacterized protein n=1 Tax=Maribacter litoralis TaxID=2059726 RepID=A0A653X7Q6_9FLAO|nr:hypothetical protein MARI151_60504 [Maribacter litoralis]